MSKLVVTMFLSIDGVVQGPGGPEEDTSGGFKLGGWLVPYFNEEMGESIVEWFSNAEAFLLGRKTYEIFAGHWPRVDGANDPIARALNALPKHVASRTLSKAEWNKSSVIQGDVVEAVKKLKASGSGGELQVHGSPGLIKTLARHDLVDEYRLLTFPVLLGNGKRLFDADTAPRAFELADSKTTSTGVAIHTYRRAGEVKVGSFALDA